MIFFCLLQNITFKKKITPKCLTAWIQIRSDVLLGLIWVQTVCKDHQQTIKFDASKERINYKLCKRLGPRSGLTNCQAWFGSRISTSWWYTWKSFLKKLIFKKIQQTTKNNKKSPSMQNVKRNCTQTLGPKCYNKGVSHSDNKRINKLYYKA